MNISERISLICPNLVRDLSKLVRNENIQPIKMVSHCYFIDAVYTNGIYAFYG